MDATEKTGIGRTGILVTRLGLGAGTIGGLFEEVAEQTAIATVRRALELGINYIDTAPLYGHGKSEVRLGRALTGVARDGFVLSSKVGRLLVPCEKAESLWFSNLPPLMPVPDFSYRAVRQSLELSLERLKLDRVDLLHVHDPDGAYDEVMQGAYPALCDLRAKGIVRGISVGCWDASLLTRFAEAAEFDAFLMPGNYTLLNQAALDGLLPACARKGISIIVGAPYESGILASGARPGARFNYATAGDQILEKVRRMEAVCSRHGVPLQAAALQFPFRHPVVVSVIPGARSPEEVETAFRMFEHPVPAALWDDLQQEGMVR